MDKPVGREYLGGDIMVWRENGDEIINVERIGGKPGYVALTVWCSASSSTKGIAGSGAQWLNPAVAREVAKVLNAWAETVEQNKGYCHDPFAEEE